MLDRQRYTEAILKLIRQTQEGKIKWTRDSAPRTGRVRPGLDPLAPEEFSATLGDRTLRLLHSYMLSARTSFLEEPEQLTDKLTVYGPSNELEFEYPAINALTGLYSVVTQQAYDPAGAAEDFLATVEQM